MAEAVPEETPDATPTAPPERKKVGQNVTENYREMQGLATERALVPVEIHAVCEAFVMPDDKPLPAPYLNGTKAQVAIIQAGLSLNGNMYRSEILAACAPKFEGAKVFYDHKDVTRSFKDLAGEITGVRMVGDRMVGTLEVLEADHWLQSVLRDKPHLVGLSVFVWAYSSKQDDGTELIESIEHVQSVDLVDDPAAGGGVLRVTECAHDTNTPSAEAERDGASKADALTKEQPVASSDNLSKEDDVELKDQVAALEKQVAELKTEIAERDTKLATKDKRISELELKEAKQGDAMKDLTSRLEKLAKQVTEAKRAELLNQFLADKKVLGTALEKAIRRDASHVAELTVEALDKIHGEWQAVAEGMRAEVQTGLPPQEASDAEKKVEKKEDAVDEETDEDGVAYATGLIDNLIGSMDVEEDAK